MKGLDREFLHVHPESHGLSIDDDINWYVRSNALLSCLVDCIADSFLSKRCFKQSSVFCLASLTLGLSEYGRWNHPNQVSGRSTFALALFKIS